MRNAIDTWLPCKVKLPGVRSIQAALLNPDRRFSRSERSARHWRRIYRSLSPRARREMFPVGEYVEVYVLGTASRVRGRVCDDRSHHTGCRVVAVEWLR